MRSDVLVLIMMLKLILCIFFIIVGDFNANATFYKTNVTDLSKCRVHYSRSGSVYRDFYNLEEFPGENSTMLLDFHFSVLAPSDAHILLAPSENVENDDPVYEIVIGAGGNTFCDIRRKQKSEVKASVRVNGLLSALDPRSFWIHITKEGNIELGKEGEELALISWIDPDPLPLSVISFSTWSGIEAKWYFDCERPNEITEIPKQLTHIEKLRKDLLYLYNPYVRPVKNESTVTTVSMILNINHIFLDEYKSTFEIIGMTKLAWYDEKLIWDPADYGDLETLHIFRREIWQPLFTQLNTISDEDILGDSMMVVHSTGLVEWNPSMHLKALCNFNDMGKWPRDVHKCKLVFGFIRDYNDIKLKFNANESSLLYFESSQFHVLGVDVFTDIFESRKQDPPIFLMVFALKRISNIHDIIFFTPFLVISISILTSFWMDPFGKIKMSLNCGQLILTTVMLLSLGIFIPTHSQQVPYLVLLYSSTMVATLLSTIIAIIVINLSRNKQPNSLPHCLCKLLTSRVMEIALCLPKREMSDEYGKLHDTLLTKSEENQQLMWILLAVTIDRICFFIYLPLAIYAIYLNY